jgi:hypothetical protein
MGFNKPKNEDAAGRRRDARRARQIIKDAERLVTARKTPSQMDADAVLADHRRRHHGRIDTLDLLTPPGKRLA